MKIKFIFYKYNLCSTNNTQKDGQMKEESTKQAITIVHAIESINIWGVSTKWVHAEKESQGSKE